MGPCGSSPFILCLWGLFDRKHCLKILGSQYPLNESALTENKIGCVVELNQKLLCFVVFSVWFMVTILWMLPSLNSPDLETQQPINKKN